MNVKKDNIAYYFRCFLIKHADDMYFKTLVIWKCLTLSISHEESKPTGTFEHNNFHTPQKDTAFQATKNTSINTTLINLYVSNKVLGTSGLMAGFKKVCKS